MDLGEQLQVWAAAEELPATYPAMAQQWLVPLAQWLAAQQSALGGALLVGVNGAQGTGKTTACRALEIILPTLGVTATTLSLDDFYLDRSARRLLARVVHPMFETRGVPGTHEIELLEEVLDTLVVRSTVRAPLFDKAQDDRLPKDQWREVPAADIVLVEGWCVGAAAQHDAALADPTNSLEGEQDADGVWRRYVNEQLAQHYRQLFEKLHRLVMLRAPSFERVLEWRQLQEAKLAARSPGVGVMSPEEVAQFISYYERITRHCLGEMPPRADYLLEVDDEHCIVGAICR